MKKIILVALVLLLCACGKSDKTIKVEAECIGSPKIMCQAMMMDMAIETENTILDELKRKKETKVCKKEELYDEGIRLSNEKIELIESVKPGVLKRFFLAGWTIGPTPSPDAHNLEYIQAIKSISDCEKATAIAPASNSTTPVRATASSPDPAPAPASAPTPTPAATPATETPQSSERGKIDSNAPDLPKILNTVSGVLSRVELTNGIRRMTLNRRAIFTGEDAEWQFPVRSFKLSEVTEAILVASSGGRGTSCETLFFFLILDPNGRRNTPEFGTCSAEGEYVQSGSKITISLLKMGGKTDYVFDGRQVTENGVVVKFEIGNDPSQ